MLVIQTEEKNLRKPRKMPAWYVMALLHYQGDGAWSVGLLRRSVSTDGLTDTWEWVENLSKEAATEFMAHNQPRMARCTPGDVRKVFGG